MKKVIMLEISTLILQTKYLRAKTCQIKKKVDKSLRKTDGTGQYANFVLMRNNLCVIILKPVLVRFYRTGEESAFESHREECSSTKHKNSFY